MCGGAEQASGKGAWRTRAIRGVETSGKCVLRDREGLLTAAHGQETSNFSEMKDNELLEVKNMKELMMI